MYIFTPVSLDPGMHFGLEVKGLLVKLSFSSVFYIALAFPVCIETTQQTQDVESMLFYCWSSVVDAGPTVKQTQADTRR